MSYPTTLTPDQLTELRSELERELARLDAGMQGAKEATKPVQLDQTSVGRLSRIDAMQNQQMAAGLHDREMARYAQLLNALDRMERGCYGLCERCGQQIPFGRLLIVPEARACARCGGG